MENVPRAVGSGLIEVYEHVCVCACQCWVLVCVGCTRAGSEPPGANRDL